MHDSNFLAEISFDLIEQNQKTKIYRNDQKVEQKKIKKSKGGYRPVLIEQSQLTKESIDLKNKFELINKTCILDRNFMSSQDIVSYYLISYLEQRYPNQFLENFNQITEAKIISYNLNNFNFKNKNIKSKLEKYKIHSLFDLVNSFNLHSVPFSARYTLVNWYLNNKFDLKLFINEIPSSIDVLRMQAQSKRCVSLIADKIDCLVLNERDPLSFLLHDLVHAYKMFSNDYLLKGQIGFYKAMLKLFDNKEINAKIDLLCKKDENFREQFDYLISDMNSHPKHLFYYFKAILINAFKRKFKLSNEFLHGDSLTEFDQLFELILETFEMNEEEKSLSRKMIFHSDYQNVQLNHQQPFNIIDFIPLDNYFINLK